MTFLIDSHIFLWALAAPNKLSESRQYLLENTDNTVLVSSMTVAELCIKASLGKLELVFDPIAEGEAAGFLFEPFTASAAFLMKELPYHHKDPFDRMIIAQAIEKKIAVMTDDLFFKNYPIKIL